MEYQVRRYRIVPGKLDEFVHAWKTGVVPLREQLGFQFHGAWSIEESNEFVWVISYDRSEGFAAADAAYLQRAPSPFTRSGRTHRECQPCSSSASSLAAAPGMRLVGAGLSLATD